jgi:hypothetical protein
MCHVEIGMRSIRATTSSTDPLLAVLGAAVIVLLPRRSDRERLHLPAPARPMFGMFAGASQSVPFLNFARRLLRIILLQRNDIL